MLCCLAPHGFTFVELSNFKMFFSVLLIYLKYDVRILVHFLVGLSNDESFFSFTSQNQEFYGFFFCTLSVHIVGDQLCGLRKHALGSKHVLSFFWVV